MSDIMLSYVRNEINYSFLRCLFYWASIFMHNYGKKLRKERKCKKKQAKKKCRCRDIIF